MLPQRRKVNNRNIVTRLQNREAGIFHNRGPSGRHSRDSPYQLPVYRSNSVMYQQRKMYQDIVPNCTCYNIVNADCYIVKFDPAGQYLISIDKTCTELIVYEYKGYSAGVRIQNEQEIGRVPNRMETFFSLKYRAPVCRPPAMLCTNFCLFWDNFVILASRATSRSNELNAMSDDESQFDFTFYMVGLDDGQVYDTKTFEKDFIQIGYNGGVDLYDDLFSVLSVKNQQIHLFHLKRTGEFLETQVIGQHCYGDEDIFLSAYEEAETRYLTEIGDPDFFNKKLLDYNSAAQANVGNTSAFQSHFNMDAFSQDYQMTPHQVHLQSKSKEKEPITGLTQRLLTHIYSTAKHDSQKMREFYRHFDQYRELVLWKTSFVDSQTLMIKFGKTNTEGTGNAQIEDPNIENYFFGVYDMSTTKFIAFFNAASKEFLNAYEQFTSLMRPSSQFTPPNTEYGIVLETNASNNAYCRDRFRQQSVLYAQTAPHAKMKSGLVQKILRYFPFSPQSFSPSPYFDHSLFNFDEEFISSFERPQPGGSQAIKFHSRGPNTVRFRVPTALPNSPDSEHNTPNVVPVLYIFHPFLPFIITFRYSYTGAPVVNIHYRN